MTTRRVQATQCSLAELFLRGFLDDEDILPDGNVSESSRRRAEERYGAIVRPSSAPTHPTTRLPIRRPVPPATARLSIRRPVPPATARLPIRRPVGTTPRGSVSQVERVRIRRLVEDGDYTPTQIRLDHCCVCLSRPKEYACVPCYHLCICEVCKPRLTACPLCRVPTDNIVKIYF